MIRINLLDDDDLFAKLCELLSKEFKCRSQCKEPPIMCKLYIAKKVQHLMNEKGLTVGRALKQVLESGGITKEMVMEALRNQIKGG